MRTLIFSDEFTGTSLDLSKWHPNFFGGNDTQVTAPPAGSLETDAVDPANVSVANSILSLNAVANPITINSVTYPYRGAFITTRTHFEFTYGYMEASIWQPAGAALWPAFWTSSHNWPMTGEIDVLEGHGDGNSDYHFHYFKNGGDFGPGGSVLLAGATSGWHTYAADWRPGVITWLYDNVPVFVWSDGVTNDPMYVQFNLGTRTTSAGVPCTMQVDYVRVWQDNSYVYPRFYKA